MSKRPSPELTRPLEPRGSQGRWRLGAFVLDEARRELCLDGTAVALEPKPLNLLILFVRNPGELLTRDELIELLWGGRVVSDSVLARCVLKLRQTLAPGGLDEQIVTVHGYGYRYQGPVASLAGPSSSPAPPLPSALAEGAVVAGRPGWRLEERLGQGGETWRVRHAGTGETRVFKFALEAPRLPALKREVTVHRLLKALAETGDDIAPIDLVRLLDWQLAEPPCHLEFAWCARGSLDQWLARQGGPAALPLARRVALVARIATQVGTIHAFGVLHKDLKPGNVMVLDADDPATGLPRLALADLGNGAVLPTGDHRLQALGITRLGLTALPGDAPGAGLAGTPLYLAPELLAGQPWSPQADIYALGVMLYQLVVADLGRPLAPGWEREVSDPLLCADIAAAADIDPRHRLPDARELARRLSTLDERRRADATARQEAARVQRLTEAMGRHRARRPWVLAATVVGLVGLGTISTLYVRTRRAEAHLAQSTQEAESIIAFFNEDLLGAADPYIADGGKNVTLIGAIDGAARAIPERFARAPAVAARVHLSLAKAYQNQGRNAEALRHFDLGLALAEKYLPRGSAITHQLRILKGDLLADTENGQAALVIYTQAYDDALSMRGPNDPRTLEGLYSRGWAYYWLGDYPRSAALMLPALEGAERLHPPPLGLIEDIQWSLAEDMLSLHRFAEARRYIEPAMAYSSRVYGLHSSRLLWQKTTLAQVLEQEGRLAESERLYAAIEQEALTKLGPSHIVTATALFHLGMAQYRRGNWAAAQALFEKDRQLWSQAYGPRYGWTWQAQARAADCAVKLGHAAEVIPGLKVAVAEAAAHLGRNHFVTVRLRDSLAVAEAAAAAATPYH